MQLAKFFTIISCIFAGSAAFAVDGPETPQTVSFDSTWVVAAHCTNIKPTNRAETMILARDSANDSGPNYEVLIVSSNRNFPVPMSFANFGVLAPTSDESGNSFNLFVNESGDLRKIGRLSFKDEKVTGELVFSEGSKHKCKNPL